MNKRKQRTLGVFALVIALISTTVAYAALSTTLSISGSVTKKGGTWDVHIENISNVTTTGTGKMTSTPTVSGTNLTFNAELFKPGDSVSFTFNIVNDGSISSRLSSYDALMCIDSSCSPTYSWAGFIVHSNDIIHKLEVKEKSDTEYYTYEREKYITLAPNSYVSFRLTLTYDENATTVDRTNKSMNFTASFPFKQH